MVAVVIPWKDGCEHRSRALNHVHRWWVERGYDVIIGSCGGEWSKAVAVADALTRTTADTLVISDADVIHADHEQVTAAVQALDSHGWAMPHGKVWRWTETATGRILAGHEPDPTDLAQRPYQGWPAGGTTVITRALYEAVPLDQRFVGWGQEDESHAAALTCLAGVPWRGTSDLWHLFHPPQQRLSRKWGSEASKALGKRYQNAAGSPQSMRRILEEAR